MTKKIVKPENIVISKLRHTGIISIEFGYVAGVGKSVDDAIRDICNRALRDHPDANAIVACEMKVDSGVFLIDGQAVSLSEEYFQHIAAPTKNQPG